MPASAPLGSVLRQAEQRQIELGDRLALLPGAQRHESRFEGEICLVAESLRLDAVSAVVEELLGPPAKPANVEVPAALAGAPLVEAIGGLRANQTLYLIDLGGGVSLYAAYWPWGGGARFTIKLGVYVLGAPAEPL